MIRRLDRYILSEISGPLALGFSVYTFILLMQFLFRSAELIIRRGLAVATVGKLFWFTLPNILVLTLPMSLLFGILVAVGRMSSDSELIAMRSSGVSLYRLYRPILVVSGLLGALTLWLMLDLLPAGNHNLQKLRIELATAGATGQVEPRVFNTEFPGRVVYVFEGEKRGWKGVFLAPSLPPAQHEITVADRGDLRVDETGERAVLHLDEAVTHKVDLDNPGSTSSAGVARSTSSCSLRRASRAPPSRPRLRKACASARCRSSRP
jgi:lipopolysaccharide export system permease protein